MLKDKVVLVTGSSRGIGAGIAKHLSESGAKVIITYSSSPDRAKEVLSSLAGDNHHMLQLNVSEESSVQSAIKEILEKYKKLDGLVNNAGITSDQLLLRMKPEEFDKVLNTNLKGTFLCTKAVLKPMMKQRAGSVVNITSIIGHTGNPGQANYAASKAGTTAFTKSIALEVASRNIRLNCVAPGYIQTEMTDALNEDQKENIIKTIPLERLGTVEDIAKATEFLLSENSSYMTGQTIHVNGGMFLS